MDNPLSQQYLEVTFRHGRPIAAYLYLARRPHDRSVRTDTRWAGFVIDYTSDDRPMGIEITAPTYAKADQLNNILAELGQPPMSERDFAPLLPAA